MIPSWLSISCILGLVSHHVLHVLSMKTGLEGVNYYAEVHQSKWNSYIHTLGMPFTIYGMLLWIPALCGLHLLTFKTPTLVKNIIRFEVLSSSKNN